MELRGFEPLTFPGGPHAGRPRSSSPCSAPRLARAEAPPRIALRARCPDHRPGSEHLGTPRSDFVVTWSTRSRRPGAPGSAGEMASLVSAAGFQRRGELVDELLESIPAIPQPRRPAHRSRQPHGGDGNNSSQGKRLLPGHVTSSCRGRGVRIVIQPHEDSTFSIVPVGSSQVPSSAMKISRRVRSPDLASAAAGSARSPSVRLLKQGRAGTSRSSGQRRGPRRPGSWRSRAVATGGVLERCPDPGRLDQGGYQETGEHQERSAGQQAGLGVRRAVDTAHEQDRDHQEPPEPPAGAGVIALHPGQCPLALLIQT